jgi:tRNA (guanine26-N2/guanine27-N2)-dimethyltransferase
MVGEDLVEVVEGETRLLVPQGALASPVPPKEPGFYNPHSAPNRDLSVILYRAFLRLEPELAPRTFGDALAGLGARSLRVAREVPEVDLVYINDINHEAVRIAARTAELNEVSSRCVFSSKEACHFLIEHAAPGERFAIADIDPFGSPASYLDCGLRAVQERGLLSVTATDTPVLCGVHPKVALRRYHGRSLRTEYCHELGARLLIGAVVQRAAPLELGVEALFTHTQRHYIRIYLQIRVGATVADQSVAQLGYINHCFACGHRESSKAPVQECPSCGGALAQAGPLWTGRLHSPKLLGEALKLDLRLVGRYRQFLTHALEESGLPPTFYLADRLASALGVSTPPLERLVKALRAAGFRASRTALSPKGLRTDAPRDALLEVFRSVAPA